MGGSTGLGILKGRAIRECLDGTVCVCVLVVVFQLTFKQLYSVEVI